MLEEIKQWFHDHTLAFCFACKTMIFEKDAKYERLSTGQSVPLCKTCHKEIFHPFGGE